MESLESLYYLVIKIAMKKKFLAKVRKGLF